MNSILAVIFFYMVFQSGIGQPHVLESEELLDYTLHIYLKQNCLTKEKKDEFEKKLEKSGLFASDQFWEEYKYVKETAEALMNSGKRKHPLLLEIVATLSLILNILLLFPYFIKRDPEKNIFNRILQWFKSMLQKLPGFVLKKNKNNDSDTLKSNSGELTDLQPGDKDREFKENQDENDFKTKFKEEFKKEISGIDFILKIPADISRNIYSEEEKKFHELLNKEIPVTERKVWISQIEDHLKSIQDRVARTINEKYISETVFFSEKEKFRNEMIQTFDKFDHQKITITVDNESKELSDCFKDQNYISAELFNAKFDAFKGKVIRDLRKSFLPSVYYISYPDPEGYFWDDKKSEIPESNSAFVLEISPNGHLAEFYFYSDGEMELNAATSWRAYLLPVCVIISKTEAPRKIIQKGKGALYFDKGKWKIRDSNKLYISLV